MKPAQQGEDEDSRKEKKESMRTKKKKQERNEGIQNPKRRRCW
jgi:hypothetical protein